MMEDIANYRFVFVVPKPNGIDFGYLIENYETIEQANVHFDRVEERAAAKGLSPRFYVMGSGANVVRQSKGQDKYRLEEHLRRGGTVKGGWQGQLGYANQRSA